METQEKGQITIPKELEQRYAEEVASFTEVLKFIKKTRRLLPAALTLVGTPKLSRREKKSLKLLPKAFALNNTTNQLEIQQFKFQELQVKHILVSEAFRAAFRIESLKLIMFTRCTKVSNESLLKLMCQGLQERSTAFQLELTQCSSEFLKPIVETSYLNCFSLIINYMDCTRLEAPLKNLLKRNLCYITLSNVKGLKEILCLELGRCVSELPNLTKLNLSYTALPTSGLKRLYGSMKKILDSGRLNMFEDLDLGVTSVGEKLCYTFFRLLSSDLINRFTLNAKGEFSTAVVKSVSSSLANTKNLKTLNIGKEFTSGSKSQSLNIQETNNSFCFAGFGLLIEILLFD